MSESAATWEPIGSLVPWDKNPRRNAAAVDAVAKSIERFGFSAPIVARQSDRVIIAGHTRWQAAKKMRMDKVPVRFLDIDPAEAAALALADNRIGEIAEWDRDRLSSLLRDLDAADVDVEGLGWSVDELATLIQSMPDLDMDKLSDIPAVNGESEFMIFRMSVRKEEEAEVRAAIASFDEGGEQAERIGSMFLRMWRNHG